MGNHTAATFVQFDSVCSAACNRFPAWPYRDDEKCDVQAECKAKVNLVWATPDHAGLLREIREQSKWLLLCWEKNLFFLHERRCWTLCLFSIQRQFSCGFKVSHIPPVPVEQLCTIKKTSLYLQKTTDLAWCLQKTAGFNFWLPVKADYFLDFSHVWKGIRNKVVSDGKTSDQTWEREQYPLWHHKGTCFQNCAF